MSGREFWNRVAYWMPPSVERELNALATVEERCAARRAVWRALMKQWRTWVMIVGASVVCYGLFALLVPIVRWNRTWLGWVLTVPMLAGVVLGAGVGFGMCWMMRRALRRELRGLLIARGILVCRGCGYSLMGNTSGRCPECGLEMRDVGRAD